MNLEELKRISGASSAVIEKNDSSKGKRKFNNVDPDEWKPEPDADGNCQALVRLLPPIEAGQLPWIKHESYFFQHNGKWYIENSPTMIGQLDPMDEVVNMMWKKAKATNDENMKNILRQKFRKTVKFICPILVIKDPAHPENDGKVMYFTFKKQIMEKILEKQNPEFGDDEKINVFDWIKGCNLRVRIYRVGQYPRYDKCDFSAPSALSDADIERCAKEIARMNLRERFMNPSNFKSEAELRERIAALGLTNGDLSAPAQGAAFGTEGGFGQRSEPRTDFANSAQTSQFGTATPKAAPAKAEAAPWDLGQEDDFNFDNLIPS